MAEKFLVSALKYRPQNFDSVVGQEHITRTLKNAIKNEQLAHSFLFCGPRGVGKTSCARILAKTINCTDPQDSGEACDSCDSCRTFNENTSFTIYELDAASNNGVDHIRELTEQVRFAPQGGAKYKVYIIDEVHMLSGAAFNAFLKTLEEPPPYAVFILATTEKHKIIPTILSRCQIFEFKRMTSEAIVKHLSEICDKEGTTYESEALQLIAQKSEGCMRDALSIMDKVASFSSNKLTYTASLEHLNILDYDYYFRIVEALSMQDLSKTLLLIDEVLAKGFEPESILGGMAEHFRNLMVCRDKDMLRLLDLGDSVKEKYQQQAAQSKSAFILNALSLVNDTEIELRASRNKRLSMEICFVKLAHLPGAFKLLKEGDELIKKKDLGQQTKTVHNFKKAVPILKVDDSIPTKREELDHRSNSLKEQIDSIEETQGDNNAKSISPVQNNDLAIPTNNNEVVESKTAPKQTGLSSLSKLREIKKKKEKEILSLKDQVELIELDNTNIEKPIREFYHILAQEKTFFKDPLDACTHNYKDSKIFIEGTKMAVEFLDRNKTKFKAHLRSHFKHENFDFHFEESKEATSDVAEYKSKREVFEEMATKNPHLYALRDKYGFKTEA